METLRNEFNSVAPPLSQGLTGPMNSAKVSRVEALRPPEAGGNAAQPTTEPLPKKQREHRRREGRRRIYVKVGDAVL